MEYLVTYGWALIALFAVVAILISTGAFSGSNFSTRECTFQPDLPCAPFIIYLDSGTATLRYTLANGLGFPIKIAKVTYKTNGIGEQGTIDNWDGTADCTPVGVVPSGGLIECASAFSGGKQPNSHDFKTIIATIEYFNCKQAEERKEECNKDTASLYTTSGRISSVVEPGTQ